ncbi:MAG: GDP-mannose 4,6-dehydratase [Candidatus Omnitrophica bacterium]|nr:GDP-mannose 4,6-dehydratase [Candidatus Omnitrophota bacterium]
MKNVLVTGAGGFMGSHLCSRLAESGYKVKAFVHYNSLGSWGWLENAPFKKKIKVFCGDIRNRDSLRGAVSQSDSIIHLAALIAIPYSYYSPEGYVDTNIRGTLNLLDLARERGIKKFIHISTSEVYGTAQFVPITEKHPVNPQSPYAASKSAADFLALSFYRSFDLPVVVARPFNTFGPRQSARAIIPTIITQILSGNKEIKLGSVYPTRDLTYVADTVEGFIKAMECKSSALGEVINIGSGFEVSIGELVKIISRMMGIKVRIKSEEERKRPAKSEVERLLADNSKAKKLLGWRPKYSLEEGLKDTIFWLKDNNSIYKPHLYNL